MATQLYLDLSTSHVNPENAEEILNKKGSIFSAEYDVNLYGYPYDAGTFISVGELDEEGLDLLEHEGHYKEIVKILRYCKKFDCYLIRFDADAPVSKLFEEFEW